MNKHGHPGVRKRLDYPGRRRPYYARVSVANNVFVYSRGFATAAEAGAEFRRMKKQTQMLNKPGPVTP